MKSPIEAFYDRFSRTFVRDYLLGNRRVELQLEFFRSALPATVTNVLVVGCGSGESAKAVATWRRGTEVMAVDLSEENLKLARALHAHDRVTYARADVTTDSIPGQFQAILLPDVYEHIPRESRAALHASLNVALAAGGRILITVPSVGKQASLASTRGLQIVDEIVTIPDLLQLAEDVRGALAYLSVISVWESNDYMHAVIARDTEVVRPLSPSVQVPLAGWPHGLVPRLRRSKPVAIASRVAHAAIRYAVLQRRLWRMKRDDGE